ncbi:hypothetical protein CR513_42511, partial [Mucuna pruriens]
MMVMVNPTNHVPSATIAIVGHTINKCYYEDHQASGSIASIVSTGNSFVGLSHSTSLGPWTL